MKIRAALLCLLASSANVFAGTDGYLVDSEGNPVRTGFGLCIHTSSWVKGINLQNCDGTPDRVVLLPNQDGQAGAVVIETSGKQTLLNSAYAGAEIQDGQILQKQESRDSVNERYGAVLQTLPARPQSYTVYFEPGSSTKLTPEHTAVFNELKLALELRPAPELSIIGHTDRVGKQDANDRLSLKRAETVRQHLVESGLNALTMELAGRGERDPIVATPDEIAEPRNRRVEINIR